MCPPCPPPPPEAPWYFDITETPAVIRHATGDHYIQCPIFDHGQRVDYEYGVPFSVMLTGDLMTVVDSSLASGSDDVICRVFRSGQEIDLFVNSVDQDLKVYGHDGELYGVCIQFRITSSTRGGYVYTYHDNSKVEQTSVAGMPTAVW